MIFRPTAKLYLKINLLYSALKLSDVVRYINEYIIIIIIRDRDRPPVNPIRTTTTTSRIVVIPISIN